MKQQGVALLMYAQDYDERFPTEPGNWMEAAYPYLKHWGPFHCPALNAKDIEFGYAFNVQLAGKPSESLTNSATVPMSFESVDRRKNAWGSREKFSTRHDGLGNIAFADGHGKALRQDAFNLFPKLVWQEKKAVPTKGVAKEPKQ